jgi:hypothetical protein
MRTPTVRFFGCSSRRGTSLVAGRMNVYGPGVAAFTARNDELLICTNCPSWAKSRHISVKWWRSSRCLISRIRSSPALLPIRHPSAKQESVGYAISPSVRMMSTTCRMARACGLSGCTSKYFATRAA